MIYSIAICGMANFLIVWNGQACLSLFTTDPQVVKYAIERFHTVLVFQCIASTYEISGSYMRGLGYSVTPMLLTIFGTCVLRLGWVGVFPRIDNTFEMLLTIYPITWVVTGIAVIGAALWVQHKVFKGLKNRLVE